MRGSLFKITASIESIATREEEVELQLQSEGASLKALQTYPLVFL
jgi:hypothetical protein